VRDHVSIKDIARIAKVSHSTVSRALRNSRLVNRETAERIQKIARASSYRVSAAARSLVTSKTRTLGIVVATVVDPFVAEVVSGAENMANQHGYSVFLATFTGSPEREAQVVHSFEERRVEGIIVVASRVGSSYRELLANTKIPIVLINNYRIGEFAYSVCIDNLTASREATSHLIGLGHRRIAYLGDKGGFHSDTERFGGYRQALESVDQAFQPELVVHGDGTPQGGEVAIHKLLSLPQRPTAVFCYDDMTALGALRAARTHGLRVPEDISIIGFDDLVIASYTEPPLTTIRQPKEYMGQLATEIVMKLISGVDCECNVKVRGELIIRQSTAPLTTGTASGRSARHGKQLGAT
jgi:DNA-binding LacI/PurR family transcriptional regulator